MSYLRPIRDPYTLYPFAILLLALLHESGTRKFASRAVMQDSIVGLALSTMVDSTHATIDGTCNVSSQVTQGARQPVTPLMAFVGG